MRALIHIPKTAGTSLRLALERALSPSEVVVCEGEKDFFYIGEGGYPSSAMLIGHLSLPFARMIGATRVVTVLRDPIERCISQVQHWLRELPSSGFAKLRVGKEGLLRSDRDLSWNIESVLSSHHRFLSNQISDAMAYQLGGNVQYRTGLDDEVTLQAAIQACTEAACLGKVEALPEFIEGLSEFIGAHLEIGHANRSETPSGSLSDSISRDARAMLRRANQLDMALYEFVDDLTRKSGFWSGESIPAHFRSKLPTMANQARMEPWDVPDSVAPGELSLRTGHLLHDMVTVQKHLDIVGSHLVTSPVARRDIALMASFETYGDLRVADRTGEIFERMSQIYKARSHVRSGEDASGEGDDDVKYKIMLLHECDFMAGDGVAMSHLLARATDAAVVVVVGGASKMATFANVRPFDELRNLALVAVIDDHLIFCQPSFLPLYGALVSAKMAKCVTHTHEMGRSLVYEIKSDY